LEREEELVFELFFLVGTVILVTWYGTKVVVVLGFASLCGNGCNGVLEVLEEIELDCEAA
jgi:hypothetical protein